MLRQVNGKGIACIVASALGFSLMAAFVRLCDDCGGQLSCFQKGFFRNLVAFIVATAVFSRKFSHRRLPRIPGGTWWPLLLRCVFGTVGIFANFHALSHIQVGEAMTLNKTAPFFTVLFSWIFLGERIGRLQLMSLVVAFSGAILIIRPGFGVSDGTAFLVALVGGVCAGLAYVCVHRLGKIGADGSFIVLVFSLFSCLSSVPFMAVDLRPMTIGQVLVLVGAGVGAAIGQFGITAAYRYSEPRSIAVFDYFGVVFSALFGFALFDQIPDCVTILGFVLIVVGAMRLRG